MDKPPILLDVPDEISSERLLLRAPRFGDGAMIYEAAVETAAELAPWMPWAHPAPDANGIEEWCRRSVSKRAVREQFDYLMCAKDGNRYVGTCSLLRMDWAVPKGEIGYWLRQSSHGNGYMTEAVKRLTTFGFETFNLQRIEIRCDASNQPSCKVAERAGYILEATLRNECREHREQKLRDTRIYAIIPPNQ